MNESEFNRLIEKYQRGELSKHEKALVDKWFDKMGKADEGQWSAEDKLRLKARILSQVGGQQKIMPEIDQTRSMTWYRAAAAILLVSTLAYGIWYWSTTSTVRETIMLEASSTTGLKKVILPDQSIIWLKGNSTITYPEKFEGEVRNVSLQGEALFEVAKDPAHPFIIQCGGLTATVLGTSFNIKTMADQIEVMVLTGKVALSSAGNQNAVTVLPQEKAVYQGSNDLITKLQTEEKEAVAAILHTEYNMFFKDTPMKDVIRRIEGKFNVTVTKDDPSIDQCDVTADFTDQSLKNTLSMITQILGLKYEISNGTVTLRGKGCS